VSWDRVWPAALPLLVPVGLLGMFVGESAWPLAAAAVVVLALAAVAWRADRGPTEIGWGDVADGAGEVRADRRPDRGSVPLAVAGVEIRELLLSGWFQVGAGFCVLFLVGITSYERSWWGTAALMPLLVHPLCGLTVVAVHRNVSRARRDGADDLVVSCPATTTQRLGGHLLSGVVPILTAALFVATSLVGASIALDDIYGPIDTRVATDVLIAVVVLPAGATALGVLLGRRLPFALAPIIAVALIALVDLEFWDEPDGRGWLATGQASPVSDLIYVEPPVAGRLAWLAGLVAMVTAGALWAGRRRGPRLGLAGGGVLVVAGIVATGVGPSDATAQRLAGYVLGDDEHTTCTAVSTQVDVCAPDPYRGHGAAVAAVVAPVAESIPTDGRDTHLTLRFLAQDLDELQRPVRQLIPPTAVPDGVVPLSFRHHDGDFGVARMDLAAAAVGIPVGPDAPGNVLVDGQARGVVMLWLATAGLDRAETLATLQPGDLRDASYRGHIWPGLCGADIQWAPQDLLAARVIATGDRAVTAEVLARDWDRWTDPATTTDELLAALGLPAVGPPEPIEPLEGECI
jgi:hypothetical protein